MNARSVRHSLSVLSMAGLAVAASGCVSSRVIRHDDLHPGDCFAKSVVFLQGGAQYEFLRVAVYPDTVVGEYTITVERSPAEGGPGRAAGLYYEDETHAHRMALAAVDSVAVLRRNTAKTLVYATGAAGIGYLMFRALDSRSSGQSTPFRASAGQSP
jgi:hypothetical protein